MPIDPELLAEEVAGAPLGDPRRTQRLTQLVTQLARAPERSLPALLTPAELEAAYRFFDNPAVTPEAILTPHREATLTRMAAAGTCLVIHDSTSFAFAPHGRRRGLGRIMTAGQGFFAHLSLALRADGSRAPLGLLALATWVRDGTAAEGDEQRRWGAAVERVAAAVGDRAVPLHVMDREADDYALLTALLGGGHRFVVRAATDRRLAPGAPGGARKMREALAVVHARCAREVRLTARPEAGRSPTQKRIHPTRPARPAVLAVSATTIAIERPAPQPRTLPASLTVHLVYVWEPEPPDGEEPVEWLLLTNEPIATEQDLLAVVDAYRARWEIEEYIKVLKTGCAYEARQLETYERLCNVLAVFVPIAWHLLAMRRVARAKPDAGAPAETVLDATSLAVLRSQPRCRLTAGATAQQALWAIAALGGHLRHNGEPGWLTLSRGYRELLTLRAGWEAAKKSSERSDE